MVLVKGGIFGFVEGQGGVSRTTKRGPPKRFKEGAPPAYSRKAAHFLGSQTQEATLRSAASSLAAARFLGSPTRTAPHSSAASSREAAHFLGSPTQDVPREAPANRSGSFWVRRGAHTPAPILQLTTSQAQPGLPGALAVSRKGRSWVVLKSEFAAAEFKADWDSTLSRQLV